MSVEEKVALLAEIVAEIQRRIDGAKDEAVRLAHVKDREIVKALFVRRGHV